MSLFFKAYRNLIHLLAESEELFSQPGSPLIFRKMELRCMGIKFHSEIWVGQHLHIQRYGNISLGNRVALGDYTQLINHAPIEIGDDFVSSNNLIINSGTHDPVTMEPRSECIRIGQRVWCGTRVTILSGVTVGNDVVIGAGSLVNKNIPDGCIVAGVPARLLKDLDRSNVEKLWTWSSKG